MYKYIDTTFKIMTIDYIQVKRTNIFLFILNLTYNEKKKKNPFIINKHNTHKRSKAFINENLKKKNQLDSKKL